MAYSGSKRVVVVGGGVAGALLAKTTEADANVTLIDPKDYFEIPWTNLRSMVEPQFAEKALIKHTEYLKNAEFIKSTAVNISDREVQTAQGRSVPYDYLVIATGHPNTIPVDRKDRLEQFRKDSQKIKSANSILIVGGGPTGVELAGEIAVDYPGKKVTLVHSGSRLLEFIGQKASKKALKWLTSKKVDVLLEQKVDLESGKNGVYTTTAGKRITADCHFLCIGQPVGSSWFKETMLRDSLDARGRLKVDDNLRVKGKKNIFAIGDITDVKELKLGFLAQAHAGVVTKNLKMLVKGLSESKLAKYKPGPAIAMVSLGRKEGIAQFPFMTMGGRMPGMMKSKDLFVPKTRKSLGVSS